MDMNIMKLHVLVTTDSVWRGLKRNTLFYTHKFDENLKKNH